MRQPNLKNEKTKILNALSLNGTSGLLHECFILLKTTQQTPIDTF